MLLVWDTMVVSSHRYLFLSFENQCLDHTYYFLRDLYIHFFCQESGQLSVTDYVRITSTEW